MRSLRQRAIIGGLVWATLTLGIGGLALYSFFDNQILRRFDATLIDRHVQVVVALSNADGDPDLMGSFIADAAYERPYSGRYWQATGPDDIFIASRSLFDATLPAPVEPTEDTEFWVGQGPESELRGVSRTITYEDDTTWVISIAETLDALNDERTQVRDSLLTTFALVGVMGFIGAVLQTSAVVRPLAKLREDVAHRWDSEIALEPTDYPEEVVPLVVDINTLLDRNREIIERARRQAADLAHALKTPTAILRNELSALGQSGIDVAEASNALDRVDAQMLRSLARIRAANTGASGHAQTNLANSVARMARLFRSMPETAAKTLDVQIDDSITMPMDVQDIEEVLGNMMENAFHWCKSTVRVSATTSGDDILLKIEDDGPGIPESSRREALRSGGRLDTSSPGTGLGMAIAADLIQAYGGTFELDHSKSLNGLCISIAVPTKHGLISASGA